MGRPSTPFAGRGHDAIRLRHPGQFVALAFAGTIALGTLLLWIPAASTEPGSASLMVALFTATSAVTVTGLVVVDTPTYWSGLGHVVIAMLIQVGGFGIMTVASLLTLLVSRRLGLRGRLVAQTETRALGTGDIRRVVLGVAAFSLAFEAVTTVLVAMRLWTGHGLGLGEALGNALFHAVSAFNNAGFALFSDSLMGFARDPWIGVSIIVPVVAGGLGFPVLHDLRHAPTSIRRWSLHTKLTVAMTGILLAVGLLAVLALEWSNPATLGLYDEDGRVLPALLHSVSARTAGFSTLDVASMHGSTWLVTSVLMFIGGGSASAAGGIKVTTFVVLAFVIWAEVRGEPHVNAAGRRIPLGAQRQALSVALVAVATTVTGTLALMILSGLPLARSSFEVISAFATTGLSTGITADLEGPSRIVLIVLMFVGRLGPITLATALALREKERRYRRPEERPIIG